MTLDEAIEHAEEVAEQNEWFEKNYLESIQCRKCAEEHRQLAEWLRELKQLRDRYMSDNNPNFYCADGERRE